jgi:hypothetical protein
MPRAHAAHRLARAGHAAEHVDGKHALDPGRAHLVHPCRQVHHAGVVHQPCQRPQFAVQGLEHGRDRAIVGHVGLQREGTPALGLHRGGDGLGRAAVVPVVDGHIPTLGGGQQRSRGADAAAGAGDEEHAGGHGGQCRGTVRRRRTGWAQ